MENVHQFFKYRKVDKRLIDSIVNQTIYFASPSQLNDPLDCQPDLRKSLKRAFPNAGQTQPIFFPLLAEDDSLLDSLDRHLKTIGVCCFSTTSRNSVLWSHYADEHQGVCLMYEFDFDLLHKTDKSILGLSRINYSNDPITMWLMDNLNVQGKDLERLEQLVITILTSKSAEWKYEQEARIIKASNGNLQLPKGSLAQICFGMRTPEHDVALIKRLASTHAGCQRFARIVRSDNDFGIEMVEEPPA